MKFPKLILSLLILNSSFQQTNAFDLKKIASENYGKIIGTILLNAVLTKYFYYYDLKKAVERNLSQNKAGYIKMDGETIFLERNINMAKSKIWHKVLPVSFLKSSFLTSALLLAHHVGKKINRKS